MPAYDLENCKMCYIYEIYNNISKKVYVGSTKNIQERFKRHIKELKENRHHNIKLQRSWNSHDEQDFEFRIINSCDESKRWEIEKQRTLLYKEDELYNIAEINKIPSRKGRLNSSEHRLKISISKKDKVTWNKGGKNTWAHKAGLSQVMKNKNIIKATNSKNNEIKYFLSSSSASSFFGYKRKRISNILCGLNSETRDGWMFEWVEKTEQNVLLSEGYFASIRL